MSVQSFTCLARILTELFEKNEIQFGPTEEMYGRKTVLVYARPTGKNTMTESNKNSSTLVVIGVARTAVLTPPGQSATRSNVTGVRNKSVVTEIYA